jgi:uncharacterized protein YxjI
MHANLMATALFLGGTLSFSSGFIVSPLSGSTCRLHPRSGARSTHSGLRMNFFSDVGDMLTGGKLVPQSSLPYSSPLSSDLSISNEVKTFAVRERAISFTGEDFDIADASDGSDFLRVRGAMLHLPGKDMMRIKTSQDDEEVVVLDRKLVSATPTYDIFRGGMGAEKIGWIEKKLIALTDTFDIYMEGKGGFGVTGLFKPPPAYRITGDFIDRNFVMKNEKDETVAKVSMDGLIQFDAFNHYQVQVAPGMDAILVLAAACAIDEEFDEEHKERKMKLM